MVKKYRHSIFNTRFNAAKSQYRLHMTGASYEHRLIKECNENLNYAVAIHVSSCSHC